MAAFLAPSTLQLAPLDKAASPHCFPQHLCSGTKTVASGRHGVALSITSPLRNLYDPLFAAAAAAAASAAFGLASALRRNTRNTRRKPYSSRSRSRATVLNAHGLSAQDRGGSSKNNDNVGGQQQQHQQQQQQRGISQLRRANATTSTNESPRAKGRYLEALKLKNLGGTFLEKALSVNLDSDFYGSFAEIGAGQEVSRTFLKAGAAAGTVARSISAYDMRMSDVNYGKAKRYVTNERLHQMLSTEYEEVERCLRDLRGPQCRFFAFASTLAAKAYRSDRECEGWIGLTYQAEPGQEPSSISLHVRMRDPTASMQGEAVGMLGTNLVYLAHNTSDPYVIVNFLLDGLELSTDESKGRLEVDFVDFQGPAFPAGSWDPRVLAMRMVQWRIATGVLLEPEADGTSYKMAVPNSMFYKRPVVVERSRFAPVTYMHEEVMDACSSQMMEEAEAGTRPTIKLLNLQIDDLIPPASLAASRPRTTLLKRLAALSEDDTGAVPPQTLKALIRSSGALAEGEVEGLFGTEAASLSVDALCGLSEDSLLAEDLLDRFVMLQCLGYPVLLSSISQTHDLASYLRRYTREAIGIAVGGGGFSIKRALFDPAQYASSGTTMLESLGRVAGEGDLKIYAYPNIAANGDISPAELSTDVPERPLYEYLRSTGTIRLITDKHLSKNAKDPTRNQAFRLGSTEVRGLIAGGSTDWRLYVPSAVAALTDQTQWVQRLERGQRFAQDVWKVLAAI